MYMLFGCNMAIYTTVYRMLKTGFTVEPKIFLILVLILELILGDEMVVNNKEEFAGMDIKDIADLFKPPDKLKENITFRSLNGRNVGSLLENMANSSTERLYLSIKSSKIFHQELDLSPLENMPSLKWLWIVAERKNGVSDVSREDSVIIKFSSNRTDSLLLTRVHINIPIDNETLLYALLCRLKHLEILDLTDTLTIARNNLLPNILNSLKGKPLIALSLQRFQTIELDNFMETINLTKLLWAIKDCPLRYLDISKNYILTIEAGFYAVTKEVEYLDISHNNLVKRENSASYIELMLHPSLKVIKIDHQGYSMSNVQELFHYSKKEIPQNNYLIPKKVLLKPKIPQEPNRNVFKYLGHYDYSFLSKINECMRRLNLNISQLQIKHNLCIVANCINPLWFNGVPCELLPSLDKLLELRDSKCAYGIRFPLPSNLSTITASNLHFTARADNFYGRNELICYAPNNLKTVVISQNARICDDFNVAETINKIAVKGFENVDEVDVSFNLLNITIANSPMLRSLVNLKKLFLGGNQIIISRESSLCSDSLHHIEVLDLSRNNLQTIPSSFVKQCQTMKTLDLSFNKISSLSLYFNDNSSFRLLNLSYNNISSLNMVMRNSLKNVASKITDEKLIFDLKGNPLACGCSTDSINTAKLILNAAQHNIVFYDSEHYECVVIDKSVLVKNVDMKAIEALCFPSYFYTILFTTLVNLAFVIAVIGLCLMYKFRYRLYTSCLRCYRSCQVKPQMVTGIKYDAFISYSSADRFWVHSTLMTELENKYGFKLCIHYRDFPAHGDIADVIVNHIKMSRSIIVILSEYSMKSPWCDFELKNAHAQSVNYDKPFIVIKMGKVSKSLVDGLVEHLLSSKVYIEWPEDEEDNNDCNDRLTKQKQALFWEKIVREIYEHSYCKCLNCGCCCCNSNKEIQVPLLDDQDHSFY